jgi:hypothetical protein
MSKLNTTVYTIEDGKVVEGTLNDFLCFIEQTTRPHGVGTTYYVVENDDGFALVKWASWGGPERLVRQYETEVEAQEALEDGFVYDIENNPEIGIFYGREEAEKALADNQE